MVVAGSIGKRRVGSVEDAMKTRSRLLTSSTLALAFTATLTLAGHATAPDSTSSPAPVSRRSMRSAP